jgi:hypothetical protein
MEPINLIRVFIASPGDVAEERRAVTEACSRTNIELGDYLKIRLEPIEWETHTFPTHGPSIQEAILEQIPFERLDLFIGILSNRFGTPTKSADSGTEEEFLLASQLYQEKKKPHIMLYFGDKTTPSTKEEIEQRAQVEKFRESLNNTIYQRYKQDDISKRTAEQVFANLFRTHLSMWLTRVAPPPPRAADVPDEYKIIHLTITDFEWYHLLQLWKSDPHSYDPQASLEREMRTLERMQLIRFKNQVSRWDRLPRERFFLRDHVELTDFGRYFIEWRRQFLPYNELW